MSGLLCDGDDADTPVTNGAVDRLAISSGPPLTPTSVRCNDLRPGHGIGGRRHPAISGDSRFRCPLSFSSSERAPRAEGIHRHMNRHCAITPTATSASGPSGI